MKTVFRRGFFIAAFFTAPILLPAEIPPVRIVRSEPASITLEMNLPPFRFEDRIIGDRLFREIRIDGWGSGSIPGDPALPVTGTLLEAPTEGRLRLTVLSASFETIAGYDAPAVPRPEVFDEDGGPAGEAPKGPAFFQNGFYPDSPVRLSETLRLRGLPVVRLLFHPFQWNPATGELRLRRRITVRVDFDGPWPEGPAAEDEDGFSGPARSAIINRTSNPIFPSRRRVERSDSGLPYQNRLRLTIGENGLYRIGYEDVAAAGISPASLNPLSFRLFRRGVEVAFAFRGQSPTAWIPGDSLEFYGDKIASEFTNDEFYWLTWASGPGLSYSGRRVTAEGTGEPATTFRDTLSLEENLVPWFQAPEAETLDHWFWMKMTAPAGLAIPFFLPDDTGLDESTARFRAFFQGRSTGSPHPNHRTQASINQVLVSDERWDNDRVFVQTADFPQTILRTGGNVLRLDMPRVSTGDVVYFNRAVLEYRRGLNARQNEILFSPETPGFKSFEIGGFSSPEILVYDVSNPERPVAITGYSVISDGGSFEIRFDAEVSGDERFYLAAANRIRRPKAVEFVPPGILAAASNRADLILIAPRDLQEASATLLAAQAARRIRPFFAAVEDIFDEFGEGVPDPAAIKAFLRTAYEGWQRPAPLQVLLLGESNYDYKDYLGLGKSNQVPAHFTWMNDTGLTADDNWYACVDGDDRLPDLFIGRIPGGTPDEARETARKLAAFSLRRTSPARSALLVADDGDYQFRSMNDQIVPLLPAGYAASKIYLDDYADKNQASLDLIAGINAGTFLVHFAGHGNVTLWTGELILDNAKVADLSNSRDLALFCAYTCNNGFFPNAPGLCMAETYVAAADKGAFAFLASTSSGLAWVHEIMAVATARSLFRIRAASLGAIFTEAKLDAFARGASLDALAKFTLFGDPSQRIEIR